MRIFAWVGGRRAAMTGSSLMSLPIMVLTMVLLVGCGGETTNTAPAETSGPGGTNGVSTTATSLPESSEPDVVRVVDHGGREVEVPAVVERVYCTAPTGLILVYSLVPEKLVGVNYEFNEAEKRFLLPDVVALPVLGGWFGKNQTGNVEEILKTDPDVVISAGTVDDTSVSNADRIQQQLGRPVLMLDGSLTKLPAAYELLGRVMGAEETAEQLAAWCEEAVNSTAVNAADITEAERVRVFYAQGTEGLETETAGSIRVEVLELAGGVNVAEVPAGGTYGRTAVSPEQIIGWDPALIIVGSDPSGQSDAYVSILEGSTWQPVAAVKDRKVYETPQEPFNWFDRPDSVNRAIGVIWMAQLLYPDVFDYDLRARAKEFYSLFYHYELSDAELDEILDRSVAAE